MHASADESALRQPRHARSLLSEVMGNLSHDHLRSWVSSTSAYVGIAQWLEKGAKQRGRQLSGLIADRQIEVERCPIRHLRVVQEPLQRGGDLRFVHYKRASDLVGSLDERRIETPIGGLDAIYSKLSFIWMCWFECKPSSSARYGFRCRSPGVYFERRITRYARLALLTALFVRYMPLPPWRRPSMVIFGRISDAQASSGMARSEISEN